MQLQYVDATLTRRFIKYSRLFDRRHLSLLSFHLHGKEMTGGSLHLSNTGLVLLDMKSQLQFAVQIQGPHYHYITCRGRGATFHKFGSWNIILNSCRELNFISMCCFEKYNIKLKRNDEICFTDNPSKREMYEK